MTIAWEMKYNVDCLMIFLGRSFGHLKKWWGPMVSVEHLTALAACGSTKQAQCVGWNAPRQLSPDFDAETFSSSLIVASQVANPSVSDDRSLKPEFLVRISGGLRHRPPKKHRPILPERMVSRWPDSPGCPDKYLSNTKMPLIIIVILHMTITFCPVYHYHIPQHT